jgi:hypothetical protein
MRKNTVREWVQDDLLKVVHVSGCLNPADIFTMEMHNGAHFQCLRDSFMCALSDFLQQSLIEIYHSRQHDEPSHQQILPSAASSLTSFAKGSYLLALCSSPLSRTLTAISHCRSPHDTIFTLGCPISIDMTFMITLAGLHPLRLFLSPLRLVLFPFVSWIQGWGVLVCPWSASC